jgi:D-alanyl-D-alanine carboxypeptidase (penicillin-binding protein 5/6)
MQEGNDTKINLSRPLRTLICLAAAVIVALSILASCTMQAFAVEEPEITAKSAILYCENTGDVIYRKNANKRLEPYSTTKLMTALLVAERLDLDKKVTVSKEAASQEGSSMGLKEGEVLTVDQLLHGMLIVSGNDAAYALAEAAGDGDVSSFVDMMNSRARALGCKNTHFVNPNGISKDGHYTTASDFLKISRAAMSNDIVRKIAGDKKYVVPATNKSKKRVLKTHTDLLTDSDSGVVAGKTGQWYNKATIVLKYNKEDLKLILVLLGDDIYTRTDDEELLFEYARQSVSRRRVAKKGTESKKLLIRCGARSLIRTSYERNVYAYYDRSEDSSPDIKTKVNLRNDITAPVKKGDRVGTVSVYVNGKRTSSAPIVAAESVEKGWFPSYIYISNRATIVIACVLVILIAVRSSIKKSMRKKKRRRRRPKDTYVPKH